MLLSTLTHVMLGLALSLKMPPPPRIGEPPRYRSSRRFAVLPTTTTLRSTAFASSVPLETFAMPPPEVAATFPVTTQLAIVGADCQLKMPPPRQVW